MSTQLEAGQLWEYTGTNEMDPAGDVNWYAGSWIVEYHERLA